MPPKTSKSQRKAVAPTANKQDLCCICTQKIGPKDEVLFCSGTCQKYLHRYCASVGESSYKALTSEGAQPFLCFCCFRAQKDEQVAILFSVIDTLKAEINALKTGTVEPPQIRSYAKTVNTQKTSAAAPTPGESTTNPVSRKYHQDNKFNAVLYGVQECPSGMSKPARFESDLTSVVNVLSSLDSSIQSQSIKDCFRLGKFSSGASRPRPILIKFVRVADVASILAKKKNLSHPYSIKPDMSPDQRLQESVLMRERWSLIQTGTSRNHIRIRGNSIYVSSKLHGRVLDFKFERETQDDASPLPNSPSSRSNPPTVQRDQQSSHHVHVTQAFDESNVSSVDDTCSQHRPPTSVGDNPSPTSPTQSNVPSPQS